MSIVLEELLESVDLITQARIKDLELVNIARATILDKVVNESDTYWVEKDTLQFAAKNVTAQSFEKNDSVYILFTNGDYNTGERLIIGSYKEYQDIPVTLQNKWSQMITQNEFNNKENSLVLNNRFTERTCEIITQDSINTTCDYLGLKVKITSYLKETKGEYQLKIDLLDMFNNSLLKGNQLIYSSNDIMGNPYNLPSDLLTYQKVWKIPEEIRGKEKNIAKIKLILLSNDIDLKQPEEHITFSDFNIIFGKDIESFGDQSIVFDVLPENRKYTRNTASVDIIAYPCASDGKGVQSILTDNQELRWYKYSSIAKEHETDAIGGKYWLYLNSNTSQDKVLKLDNSQYCFDVLSYTTQIKAVLCKKTVADDGTISYEEELSNILVFDNINKDQLDTSSIGDVISISGKSNLSVYDNSKQLINEYKKPVLGYKVDFISGQIIDDSILKNNNIKIIWEITSPKNSLVKGLYSSVLNEKIEDFLIKLNKLIEDFKKTGIETVIIKNEIKVFLDKISFLILDNFDITEYTKRINSWLDDFYYDTPEGKKIIGETLQNLYNFINDKQSYLSRVELPYDSLNNWKNIFIIPSDIYDNTKTDNRLKCTLLNIGETYFDLNFVQSYSQGVGYSLKVICPDKKYLNHKVGEKLKLKVQLYDKDGNNITDRLKNEKIKWSWLQSETYRFQNNRKPMPGYPFSLSKFPLKDQIEISESNDKTEVILILQNEFNSYYSDEDIYIPADGDNAIFYSPKANCNSHILQVSCDLIIEREDGEEQSVTLVDYFPVPIITPALTETYSFSGIFNLNWDYDNTLMLPYDQDNLISLENFGYTLKNLNPQIGGNDVQLHWEIINENGYNIIDINNNYILDIPKNSSFTRNKMIVQATNNKKQVIFQCPILTTINQHPIDLTNQWVGGKVSIKDEEGSILATTIGAGHKDNENRFTGIIMGDVQTNSQQFSKTGLFGFNEGMLGFELNSKGELFIGTGDKNCLTFKDRTFKLITENFTLESSNTDKEMIFTSEELNTFSFSNEFFSYEINNCVLKIKKGTNLIAITSNGELFANNVSLMGNLECDDAIFRFPKKEYDLGALEIFQTILTVGSELIYDDKIMQDTSDYYNRIVQGIVFEDNSQFTRTSQYNQGQLIIGRLLPKSGTIWYTEENKYMITSVDVQDGIEIRSIRGAGWSSENEKYPIAGLEYGPTNGHGRVKLSATRNEGDEVETYLEVTCGEKGKYRPGVGSLQSHIKMWTSKEDTAFLEITGTAGLLHGRWTLTGTWTLNGSSIATTSDLKAKNSISLLDEKYSILFDNLQPVTYKYNNGTSSRLHTGFIAQHVEEALNIANINSNEFAGLVIENYDNPTEEQNYYLRYEEFIALNTFEIQKLKKRVAELENIIAEMAER